MVFSLTPRSLQQKKKMKSDSFAELRIQPTWDEVIQWVNSNTQIFAEQAECRRTTIRPYFEITYLNLKYEKKVGNCHHCPFNGYTNWFRDSSKETSYPGFYGRIEFVNNIVINRMFSGNIFKNTGINLGSGGATPDRNGYEVFLFDADWPGIVKERVFDILRDELVQEFTYGIPNYFR